jgi:hypothetical protein
MAPPKELPGISGISAVCCGYALEQCVILAKE